MKILFGILLLFMCVYIGQQKGRALKARSKILIGLNDDIERLLNSMEYTRLPISRLIEMLTPCNEKTFWDTLTLNIQNSESLICAYDKTMRELQMKKKGFEQLREEDKGVLESFFSTLGKGDFTSEKNNIQLVLKRLFSLAGEAENVEKKYVKLYSSLGLFSGLTLFLIIL